MISLIQRHSITNSTLKTAACVCCSARPHAKAFVHAAAAAARPRKSAPSKSKLKQETISTGSSVRIVASAAVRQLSSLPAEHSQHGNALYKLKQNSNRFELVVGPLYQQAGPPRRANPTKRGHLAIGPAMQVLWYVWNKLLDGLLECTQYELQRLMPGYQHRWLGQCDELLDLAQQHGGILTTAQVRSWLIKHPETLEQMGIKPEDLLSGPDGQRAKFHINHILPRTKCGMNHPINYHVMPASDNMSFGGVISVAKLKYVGPWVAWAVLYFHTVLFAQEAGAGQLADELLLQFAPVATGGNSLLQ